MISQSIRLTAKRQATFSVQVCQELGVKPGDRLRVERREIDGAPAWVLRPEVPVSTAWFGACRRYAAGKSHALRDIRRSIARKRGAKRP